MRLGRRGQSSTLDLQTTPPPFKGRVHSSRAPRGMALGGAVPGHQLLGSLDKGFLSCPSMSPPRTEETGLEATFSSPQWLQTPLSPT